MVRAGTISTISHPILHGVVATVLYFLVGARTYFL